MDVAVEQGDAFPHPVRAPKGEPSRIPSGSRFPRPRARAMWRPVTNVVGPGECGASLDRAAARGNCSAPSYEPSPRSAHVVPYSSGRLECFTYPAMPRTGARHHVSAPSTSWDRAASDRPPHGARTTLLHRRPRPRRHAVAEHRWLRGADCSSVTRRIPGGNWVGPLSCCADCRTGRCSASAERTPLPGARPGCRDSGTTAPTAGWSSEPRRHAPSPAHRVPPGPRDSGPGHPVR